MQVLKILRKIGKYDNMVDFVSLVYLSSYDTLFGIGAREDPCQYEHVKRQFVEVAVEMCKCFRGCDGFTGIPTPFPTHYPTQAPTEAAVLATSAPSQTPTLAPTSVYRGVCHQEYPPLYVDEVTTQTTHCYQDCHRNGAQVNSC
jgi:hypothetical protein